jgi:hypothetical protein
MRCEAERWKSEPNLNSKFQIRRQQADDIDPANFLPRGVGASAPIPVELNFNSPNGLGGSVVLEVGATLEELGNKMFTGPRALPTSQVSRTIQHPAIGLNKARLQHSKPKC